jgi:maltooligosyltrehalose trehalohydrolase
VDFAARASFTDAGDPRTFERCKLDFTERMAHASSYALHRDLLKLRREEAAFRAQQSGGVDGSVLSPQAFALRFFTANHADDRVLIVNLGGLLERGSFADPLLAPPTGADWSLQWSSEDPKYDGGGTADLWPDDCWRVPAECALVLRPGPRRPRIPLPLLRRRTA